MNNNYQIPICLLFKYSHSCVRKKMRNIPILIRLIYQFFSLSKKKYSKIKKKTEMLLYIYALIVFYNTNFKIKSEGERKMRVL